jgi:hypothetical protein
MTYNIEIEMPIDRLVIFVNLAGPEYVGLMDRLIHRIGG